MGSGGGGWRDSGSLLPPVRARPPRYVNHLSNVAHVRQPRPDSGLGFQPTALKTFEVVPLSLGGDQGRGQSPPHLHQRRRGDRIQHMYHIQGLGFEMAALKNFQIVPSSLGSDQGRGQGALYLHQRHRGGLLTARCCSVFCCGAPPLLSRQTPPSTGPCPAPGCCNQAHAP